MRSQSRRVPSEHSQVWTWPSNHSLQTALAFLPPFLKKLPDNSRNEQSNSPWWPLPLLCQLCSEWLLTPSHKVNAGVWTDKEMDPWWPPRPWKKRWFHFLPSIFSDFILVKHELFCWHRPYLKKHLFCVIVISKGCSLIPLTGNLSSEGWKQRVNNTAKIFTHASFKFRAMQEQCKESISQCSRLTVFQNWLSAHSFTFVFEWWVCAPETFCSNTSEVGPIKKTIWLKYQPISCNKAAFPAEVNEQILLSLCLQTVKYIFFYFKVYIY